MDRAPTVAIALAAALLVPVAGAAGQDPGCRTAGEPGFDADTRQRVWEDDDLDGAADGRVRIDAYRGGVHVTTWNRSAWRVEIAEHDPYDQLEADVDVDAGNDSFRLRASVAPRDLPPELSPTTPDRAFGQITVTLPDAGWDRVEVDNRPEMPSKVGIGDGDRPAIDWDSIVVDGVRTTELRVDAHRDAVVAGVEAGRVDVGTDRGSLDLTGVEAGEIRHRARDGGICLADSKAGDLDVSMTDGSVRLADAGIGKAKVSMQTGRVAIGTVEVDTLDLSGSDIALEADRLAVRNLSYGATGGTVDARVVPTASGSWSFDTGDATIDLSVPAGDGHGYDIQATGHGQRPVLDIPDLEIVETSRTSIHARSVDYDDRDTRTRIEASGQQVHAEGGPVSSGEGSVPMPPEAAGAGLVAALVALILLVPKLKALAAPLYTRLSPDEVRDHAVRQQIVEIVADEPGIHFRELKRRLDAGRGILDHHLDKLVEVDLLDEARGDTYRCYFPAGEVDRRVMAVAERLRADGARAVLTALRERASASLTELADAADLSSSTVGYHLDRLEEAGLLTKERSGGRLAVDLTELGGSALDQLGMS